VRVVTVGALSSSLCHGDVWWCVKVYQSKPRKKDGVYTWRLCQPLGKGGWGLRSGVPEKILQDGRAYAADLQLPFREGIKQGSKAGLSPLELLAATCKEPP
jgi:hypothetical protein